MHHEDPQDAGCQSPHLLQDHEDPQDAGCGLQVSGLQDAKHSICSSSLEYSYSWQHAV